MRFCGYDVECYPNFFLIGFKFLGENIIHQFEISARRNDRDSLYQFLKYLEYEKVMSFGFNIIGYDYEFKHAILTDPLQFDYNKAYQINQQLFSEIRPDNVWWTNRIIPQLDLYRMRHFDNDAKRTSLKALQFAMRSQTIEDLPFEPGTILTFDQMDIVRKYNGHDLIRTEDFFNFSKGMIDMRTELINNGTIKGDVYNFSDVKIGAEYLIGRIGKDKCYSGKKPKQTFRSEIKFADVVLPKITFSDERYDAVLQWFKSIVIYPGQKDAPKPHLETRLGGLDFHFGLGGVHASVSSQSFHSNNEYIIKDIDVSGMYVAVAIANGFYPEHLGQDYVIAYKQLQSDRKLYPKGSVMNAILKLAGNGVYGNSNNPFSPFYDPKYTFTVTSNGQLQLLQLVERLMFIPGIKLIQANTDGITAYVPRRYEWLFQIWKKDWENETKLQLEEVEYKSMWIRDVNNYLAVTTDGKVKRKGAYWYATKWEDYEEAGGQWHKDHSMTVVQKVTEQMLIKGWNPEALIRMVSDPFDFMKRYKTTKGSTVFIGDKACTKTVRYYISKSGEPMKKVSQPKGKIGTFKRKNGLTDTEFNAILKTIPEGSWDSRIHTGNKSTYQLVETSIESGYLVKECNDASKFDWNDVDFDYYISEVKKLEIK